MKAPVIAIFVVGTVAVMTALSFGHGSLLEQLFGATGSFEDAAEPTLSIAPPETGEDTKAKGANDDPSPTADSGAATALVRETAVSTSAQQGTPIFDAGRTDRRTQTAQSVPQQQDDPAPVPAQNGNVSAPAAPQVDETALRYFARQGDSRRLQAEIARLRALYPGWTPPANPAALPAQGDPKLNAMWKLYADGNYAQVRKAIADRQLDEPSWAPPADLLKLLSVAEARETLINASNLKQFETVIRIASQNPSLLICDDVDVLWRVAEAFAKTERLQRAQEAYLYILKNCNDPHERLATVEKAIPLLPENMIVDLLATERPGKDGKGEFEEARAELLRRKISAASNDVTKQPVTEQDLAAMIALADRTGQASDYKLLGWYLLNHKQPEKAAEWFRKAGTKQPDAEAAQGLGLALIQLRKPREAEDALYPFHDASDNVRKVYLAAVANMLSIEPPPDFPPEVLQRIVPVIFKARDAASAQQLGWYARALKQDDTAAKWFRAALEWKADDEPSAYGLALTLQRLGDRRGIENIQREWSGRSGRIEKVGKVVHRRSDGQETLEGRPKRGAIHAISPAAIPAVDPAGSNSAVAARVARLPQRHNCSTRSSVGRMRAEAALAYGWCLMDMDRPAEAVGAFQAALDTGGTEVRRDAAWGQSLAYLSLGQTSKASIAAAKEGQDRSRSRQLKSSILEQRARAFFEAKRFTEALMALDERKRIAPETLDLMALRGYAYVSLRRYEDARRVFEAIAATGDRAGIKGLAVVDAIAE